MNYIQQFIIIYSDRLMTILFVEYTCMCKYRGSLFRILTPRYSRGFLDFRKKNHCTKLYLGLGNGTFKIQERSPLPDLSNQKGHLYEKGDLFSWKDLVEVLQRSPLLDLKAPFK